MNAFGKAAIWLAATIAAATVVFAAGQDASLPEGEGRKILERACVSCHGLDQVTSSSLDKDKWKSIIEEMRGYGAPVNDDETPILIDYLV
jgi:mono/diheme cytochrome c family protein